MTRRSTAILLAGSSIALWSLDAHAQKLPWIVLPLAASPVIAVVLSVALGVAARSWRVGLANVALVIVWVSGFVAASSTSDSDLMAWAPIVALGLHALVMVGLLVRRVRARRDG